MVSSQPYSNGNYILLRAHAVVLVFQETILPNPKWWVPSVNRLDCVPLAAETHKARDRAAGREEAISVQSDTQCHDIVQTRNTKL